MKITKIRADHYRIPLPAVLSDSIHGDVASFELITVRLQSDSGAEGVGYTYTVGSGGSAVRALIQDDLAPLLLDEDPTYIEELWDRMYWRLHWVGRGGLSAFAISAVDIALWDLKARCIDKPLWLLLGGDNKRVRAYAGGIDLQLSLDALCTQTNSFLAQGFYAIKMKVGRDRVSEDIARVAAMREWIGPNNILMIDANMRWTVEQAIYASRALAQFNIHWLEEPTAPDDVEGHARIAREGGLPIATGENLHTFEEFRKMIENGNISFPEPDASNIGGVTAWMKVARLARTRNLPVTSHGVHDIHVHLLAAVPNASYLEIHGFGLERFTLEQVRFEQGDAIAPDRPGHGVNFIWERLEPYRINQTVRNAV